MSYGLTPYDKKSYRQSKRRRRQADIADKTGRILPVLSRSRIKISAAVLIFFAAFVCVLAFLLTVVFFGTSDNSSEVPDELAQEDLLITVNRQNQLEKDYVPNLTDFENVKVNFAVADDLKAFVESAENDGVKIEIVEAYISYDEQAKLYSKELDKLLSSGEYTEVRAKAEAWKTIPPAGCSESQTGMLVNFDVTDKAARAYIERHCTSFGFVLRYPKNKEEITRRRGSNSLYRYVGKENANHMRAYQMCVEEYAEYTNAQKNNK